MDKSTPIASLNKTDDSEVVNDILEKYNNLQGENKGKDKNSSLEDKFEKRDLNKEVYNLASENVAYEQHLNKEKKRVKEYKEPEQYPEEEIYEEYENYDTSEEEDQEDLDSVDSLEEMPLWKKFINEIRIPIFIFIVTILLSNSVVQKFLLKKIPYLGNQFNEPNLYGFLVIAFLIAIISYILIRFIRI
jgi:hypothetical protein